MAIVVRNGRYEFVPDAQVSDNTVTQRANPHTRQAIRETNEGVGKDLMSIEAQVSRNSKPTPQLSADRGAKSQKERNQKAFRAQEEKEKVRKNIDIADRTVGEVAAWTPFGGLYDAYSGALLRDYGYNDEARSRGISAAIRMPLDAMGGAWAATKPLQFATSTAGALAGDYVADKTNQDGLGRFMLTGIGGAAGAGVPSLTRNISSRFTPDGWFTLGNKQYRPSLNTMSSGLPTVESRQAWTMQDLPGYQIKSLFRGSPLEKQLSKNGTLSLKQLQAYIGRNDVSTIDKELLGRVLQNHANDTHIDYNTLRQEVQGMIPQFTLKSQNDYVTYGMPRLGFEITKVSDGAGGLVDTYEGFRPRTFTFESPGIKGNAKHYDESTLGHSRTYTTADEPSVLHVMESQSDWAQMGGLPNSTRKRSFELAINNIKEQLASGDYGFATKEELESKLAELTSYLKQFEPDPIQANMVKTYLNRQLQENLKYAAQNGQSKMRYPTPESAAKIEGYNKQKVMPSREVVEQHEQKVAELREKARIYGDDAVIEEWSAEQQNFKDYLEGLKAKADYAPEHKTILKKYADFPKQFQKLFGKQSQVRVIRDPKNNSWYEVDVPQSYLDGTAEMLFKKGGKLWHPQAYRF